MSRMLKWKIYDNIIYRGGIGMKVYVYWNHCVVLNHVTYVNLDKRFITFYLIGSEDSNHIVISYNNDGEAHLEYNKIISLF